MKRIIKLTESDLHRVICESVKRVLRESTHPKRRFSLKESKEPLYDKLMAYLKTWDREDWNALNIYVDTLYEGEASLGLAADNLVSEFNYKYPNMAANKGIALEVVRDYIDEIESNGTIDELLGYYEDDDYGQNWMD